MEKVNIKVNSKQFSVLKGSTVATVIFESNAKSFRRSVSGESRFPLCGMGICFECRVSINGVKHQRSCQVLAEEGMIIETDG